ncbi:cytidylate kinase [Petrotoga sp. 8T1HF07.NaAc.6.1]|uniref:(d)CMP kinase n=1 Tax=Petrotoga sp. 8T1HF07.NaAc.6.1 TaxID=1351838 RepID=UPI00192C1286|nr:(d)CMP kinase [Petrotoga sp. 8T1HF07.NaAc.6.1]MBL5981657.1 cytidylate kinase [Petrotoga sp. 8T1HF07.NaAc.6.1]
MTQKAKKIKIAIDGPAGSGKSTIAQKLAEILKINYLNSGALYRIIGYYLNEQKVDPQDSKNIENILEKLNIEIKNNRYFLDEKDVTISIKDSKIGDLASLYSRNNIIREKVNEIIKKIAEKDSIVVDGRDIGTVVLPDSDIKIYLTASIEERAKRRWSEEKGKKPNISFTEILEEIKNRDYNDSNRSIAPLKPAQDAIIIDTTNLSIEEVLQKILKIIEERGIYGN